MCDLTELSTRQIFCQEFGCVLDYRVGVILEYLDYKVPYCWICNPSQNLESRFSNRAARSVVRLIGDCLSKNLILQKMV